MMRTEIINAILNKSAENIVISDSTKFDQIHLYGLEPQTAIKQFITDDRLPDNYQSCLSNAGIVVNKVLLG